MKSGSVDIRGMLEYDICQVVDGRPRTTREIAQLLCVTAVSVEQIMRGLAERGVVVDRKRPKQRASRWALAKESE